MTFYKDEEKINIIENCFTSIFNNSKLIYSFQLIIQIQSNLNTESRRYLKQRCTDSLVDQVRSLQRYFLTLQRDDKDCFACFVSDWEKFVLQVKTCCRLFPDFTQDFDPISNDLFQTKILSHDKVTKNLCNWLAACFEENKHVDEFKRFLFLLQQRCTQGTIDELIGNSYTTIFARRYSSCSQDKVNEISTPEYITWAQEIVRSEEEAARRQLSCVEEEGIIHLLGYVRKGLANILLLPFKDYLFYSPHGFLEMGRDWDFEKLSTFSTFYSQMCPGKDLEAMFERIVKEKMEEVFLYIEKDPARGVEMTVEVLDKSSKLFALASTNCPEKLYLSELNRKGFAEAVSMFYDRSVKKMKADAATLETISKILHVVEDEEALDRALMKSMSVRLANADPKHLEVERKFLVSMQSEGSTRRVGLLERIIADIESSWSLSEKFVESKKVEFPASDAFRATILRGAALLPFVGASLHLPERLLMWKSEFSDFYSTLHNGRRLVFLLHLGRVKFDLHHGDKVFTITAPTSFASTIATFNEDHAFSVPELSSRSGLDNDATAVQLNKLLFSGLVVEEEKGRFTYNQRFFSNRSDIVVGDVMTYSSEEDGCAAHKMIQGRGKCVSTYLLTSIMRELKAKSPMPFKELLGSVLHSKSSKLSYVATASDVKGALENLLERDLITRTSEGYSVET